MRFSRPRFSLRWLMIAIAIAGILLGVGIEGERRRERFKNLRSVHEIQCIELSLGVYDKLNRPPGKPLADLEIKMLAFHSSLYKKYEWASRYPWLPVAPDPPEPVEHPIDTSSRDR